MEKNYYKAIILSLIILIGYPLFLKWFYPSTYKKADSPKTVEVGQAPKAEEEKPLSPPEGTYLEQAVKPTIVPFENELYQIEFSTLGGTVTRLFYKGEPGKRELTQTEFFDSDPQAAGTFGVNIRNAGAELSSTIFKLARRGEASRRAGISSNRATSTSARRDPTTPCSTWRKLC